MAQVAQMTFSEKLKQLLQEKGWSVAELHRQSGIAYPTLKSYLLKSPKKRLPSYGHVVQICRALEKSTDVFKDCDDWKNSPSVNPDITETSDN